MAFRAGGDGGDTEPKKGKDDHRRISEKKKRERGQRGMYAEAEGEDTGKDYVIE